MSSWKPSCCQATLLGSSKSGSHNELWDNGADVGSEELVELVPMELRPVENIEADLVLPESIETCEVARCGDVCSLHQSLEVFSLVGSIQEVS